MATITLELTDAQKLAHRIGALTVKEMPVMVHAAVSESARAVERTAKTMAQSAFTSGYSTGETQERIDVYLDRGGMKGAFAKIGVVGEGFSASTAGGGQWDRIPIGYFWEYGFLHGKRGTPNRQPMKERPFMRPALDAQADTAKASIRSAIDRAVRKF